MHRISIFIAAALFGLAFGCSHKVNTGPGEWPDAVDAASDIDSMQADTAGGDGSDSVEDIQPETGDIQADGLQAADALSDAVEDIGPGPLAVDHIKPDRGLARGGQKVNVTGSGFTPQMQVLFGNQPAKRVLWVRKDTLEVTTPPHPPGVVDVTVMRPDGASRTLAGAFTFYNKVTITSVEPALVPVQGGIPVKLHGSGFSGLQAVWFGDVRVNLARAVNDSLVNCVAPAHTAGRVTVSVSAASGEGTAVDAITYYERPSIDYLKPPAGPVAGGNQVVITGIGLDTASRVTFGALDARIQSKTNNSITVKVPASHAGPVDIQVTTDHGTAILAHGYTYMDTPAQKPTILGVFPNHGPVTGQNKVMLAINFTPQSPKVMFGQADAQVIDKGAFFVQVTAPAGKAGVVDVSLEDAAGEAGLAQAYTYERGVALYSVSPASGRAAGGEVVQIKGAGFDDTCTVWFGNEKAGQVQVTDASTLAVTTPAHQPATVDVRVECGGGSAVLPSGFVFTQSPRAEVLSPNQGSVEGGTLVRVSGTGFFGKPQVLFNGNPASHVEVVSSDLLTLRTPIGREGPVDVSFRFDDGSTQTLPGAFVYYDPASSYGGTWGGPNMGTLNVTAYESGTGKRVADAYVIVGTDPSTPYQGYTDHMGMISFAGPDLQPPLTVSISKKCFASESVVVFDSTNVTFIMTNTCQSNGGMPPGVSPGTLTGRISGLGKYVLPPPGNCYLKGVAPDGINCKQCGMDWECGTGNKCIPIADYGTFCATACTKPSDCPDGWHCSQVGENDLRCIPLAGEKLAECGITAPDIFHWNPKKQLVKVHEGGTYTLQSRPGTVSVVCVGGVYDKTQDLLTPMVMGVRRNIVVHEGDTINNLDIKLDIMLNHKLKLRLDHPPLKTGGPDFLAALIYYDFGGQGVFGSLEQPVVFGDDMLVAYHQPPAFKGRLAGVTYTILGGAFSFTQNNSPMSITHAWGIEDTEDDVFYLFDGDKWYADRQGLSKDLYASFGLGIGQVYVVGEKGAAYVYDGHGFQPQLLPVSVDMYGIWGSGPDNIYAVGDKGVIVHFNGQTWQQTGVSFLKHRILSSIGGRNAQDIYVGGQYIAAHFDGTRWSEIPANLNIQTILCTDDGCFAGGTLGNFATLSPTGTQAIATSTSKTIYALVKGPDNCIYLGGEKGYLAKYCNGQVTGLDSPTDQTLRTGIVLNGSIVFLGNNGAIVQIHDGMAQSLFVDHYKPDIYTAYADPKTGKAAAFGASHLLLGPMLDPAAPVYPQPGGVMKDLHLDINFKDTPHAALQYVTIAIPGMFGDTPVWNLITAGDVKHIKFPDIEAIEGNPGIPAGGTYKATVMRMYAPKVNVDDFDFTDLDPTFLKAWTITTWTFSR